MAVITLAGGLMLSRPLDFASVLPFAVVGALFGVGLAAVIVRRSARRLSPGAAALAAGIGAWATSCGPADLDWSGAADPGRGPYFAGGLAALIIAVGLVVGAVALAFRLRSRAEGKPPGSAEKPNG